MTKPLKCAAAPCKSCPYRRDTPSGVWEAHEYDKLPAFDGEIAAQAFRGAFGVFMCHQRDGCLCAGWVATHGAHNLLALRLGVEKIDPSVWDYRCPVPVFGSGQEAADHGKRDIDRPGESATRMVNRLAKKIGDTP
jgi:hypothetical protein